MSILDVWEKKILSFSHRAVDRAHSFSETARLRSLLAGEDKNFHSLCTQIGEQYVKLHREDYEPAVQELMTLCQESMDRSKGYSDQLLAIKKVRPCPQCGAEVPTDYQYCNFCGARLPEVEPVVPSGSVKCPGCGAVIPDTMKFCNHCGTRQPDPVQAAPEPAPTPEAPAAELQEEPPVSPAETEYTPMGVLHFATPPSKLPKVLMDSGQFLASRDPWDPGRLFLWI